MKADILKRLDALEKALSPVVYPVLTMIEVHKQPDAIRERYWQGDVSALALPEYSDLPNGTVHTIIVDLGETGRNEWERTRHMTEDEWERYDEARIQKDDGEPARPVVQKAPEPKFDQWGYVIPG